MLLLQCCCYDDKNRRLLIHSGLPDPPGMKVCEEGVLLGSSPSAGAEANKRRLQ